MPKILVYNLENCYCSVTWRVAIFLILHLTTIKIHNHISHVGWTIGCWWLQFRDVTSPNQHETTLTTTSFVPEISYSFTSYQLLGYTHINSSKRAYDGLSTLHLKMLTRSSVIVNLKARAEWCDSKTHMSLYNTASSWFELQRKALKQKLVHTHHHH
jgi:hypothetical protein